MYFSDLFFRKMEIKCEYFDFIVMVERWILGWNVGNVED